jgi:hypothetical protein
MSTLRKVTAVALETYKCPLRVIRVESRLPVDVRLAHIFRLLGHRDQPASH